MDYWISSKDVQMGPYTWDQLQLMWQQGQLTSDTFLFESIRGEWLLLQAVIESNRQLFTVEEAFVQLSHTRQTGCLLVFNKEEDLHLYVENGYIVRAVGRTDQGELALSRALHLADSTYEWFMDSKSPVTDLRINIHEYALKHSLARDIRVNAPSKRQQNTAALPKVVIDKISAKLKFTYFLVPEEAPTSSLRLVKTTSVLGREEFCDLVIEDNQISRKHCLLETSEKNVKVKDLDSSNGTFVNGIPVHDGYLHVGDELSLGGYIVVLHKEQKRAPEFNG